MLSDKDRKQRTIIEETIKTIQKQKIDAHKKTKFLKKQLKKIISKIREPALIETSAGMMTYVLFESHLSVYDFEKIRDEMEKVGYKLLEVGAPFENKRENASLRGIEKPFQLVFKPEWVDAEDYVGYYDN